MGKFEESNYRSWRQKFLIQLKALNPKLNVQFEKVERDPSCTIEPEIDANVYAALTQQCGGSFTGM